MMSDAHIARALATKFSIRSCDVMAISRSQSAEPSIAIFLGQESSSDDDDVVG